MSVYYYSIMCIACYRCALAATLPVFCARFSASLCAFPHSSGRLAGPSLLVRGSGEKVQKLRESETEKPDSSQFCSPSPFAFHSTKVAFRFTIVVVVLSSTAVCISLSPFHSFINSPSTFNHPQEWQRDSASASLRAAATAMSSSQSAQRHPQMRLLFHSPRPHSP